MFEYIFLYIYMIFIYLLFLYIKNLKILDK